MISVRFYGFNTRVKPLDDRRVRQAIVHAIDREAIVEDVYFGQVHARARDPAAGHARLQPAAAPGTRTIRRRRASCWRGRAIPAGRGLPTFAIWSSVQRDDIVREHDADQEVAGGGRHHAPRFHYHTDWSAFSKLVDDGKLPIFLWAWYADVPDPDNFLTKLFHSKSSRNFFGYANPAVDDLLVERAQPAATPSGASSSTGEPSS